VAGTLSTTEAAHIEQQLEVMERAVAPRPPTWAWILVVLGFVVAIGLAAHAATVYVTIDRVNQISRLDTLNPVLLFQELATNGPRVSANVDSTNRGLYGRALTLYVVDGTGICIGLVLAFAGLFIRINR
jgi:hypothetical protein